jgi:hypothetical protein
MNRVLSVDIDVQDISGSYRIGKEFLLHFRLIRHGLSRTLISFSCTSANNGTVACTNVG